MAEPLSVVNSLTGAMYADAKQWIVRLAAGAKRWRDKRQVARFHSPAEFIVAGRDGQLQQGQEILLDCRPSPFGPFLRRHFLSTFIGPRTDMRRGPVASTSHPIFGLFAQIMSHLTPVGLYPAVGGGVRQVQLYAADTLACGTVSLAHPFAVSTPSVAALVSEELEPFLGKPMRLRARARFMDALSLAEAGFSVEDHEVLRQEGTLWFVDATDDIATAEVLEEAAGQLWGGLYAEGHAETEEGSLPRKPVFDAVAEAMDRHGVEPVISESQGPLGGVTCYGVGLRAHFHKKAPFYSLHMDVELLSEFGEAHRTFDDLIGALQTGFEESCRQRGLRLLNPHDLDFTYANATEAYSVLRSKAAEEMSDPVAVAIRDWHRARGVGRE